MSRVASYRLRFRAGAAITGHSPGKTFATSVPAVTVQPVDTAVRKLLTAVAHMLDPSTAASHPQPLHINHTVRLRVMHNPVGAASSADNTLSPTCTGLITVIEIPT